MFHSGSQEASFEDFHRLLCRLQWTAASTHPWLLNSLASYAYFATFDCGLPLDLQHDVAQVAWQQLNQSGPAALLKYDPSQGIASCRSWWVGRFRSTCRNVAVRMRRQYREFSNSDFESVDVARHDHHYEIREWLEQLGQKNKRWRAYVELILRGLSVDEIAQAMNLTVDSIYKLKQAVKSFGRPGG